MLSPAQAKAELDAIDREDALARAKTAREAAEAALTAAQNAIERMSQGATREMRRASLARIVDAGIALDAARDAERKAAAAS